MIPKETHIHDMKMAKPLFEMGKAWVHLCVVQGMSKQRVKEILQVILDNEEWEKK